ncbi:retrovirus-related pol polyprotein from transposon TNT 1-94 [Tanacetum coccineum]
MDTYRGEGMGDVIVGEPFLREVGIKERRFNGMITIYNGNDEVTYQMVRSHLRFKHHTNEQCNKIPPLLKVSEEDKKNGISHPYQKLKGFYTGVLDLGPDYIRDAKTDTLACMRWNSKEKLKKIIMEYLVNISKRRAFWSLNEEFLEDYYSEDQYAVSIKEDTVYPAGTARDHKGITINTLYQNDPICQVVPFEEQFDDFKKKLAKNNEAKMVLYNALPKKEYERIFMCKMAKDIWQSLLITHQGNSHVKDNKIDLLVQQYEQFTILEEESVDSGFARFNTNITCLKALDEGFSSKNYVRKFLRDLHHKWRAKVTSIEESKDLSSLALDELIGNLKVHEVVREKDSKIYKGKKERAKSIALKAKKESSNDETSTSKSDDEEYDMAVRNFKKFFRRKGKFDRQPREEKNLFRQRDEKKGKSDRKCFRCGDPNHIIGDCPKPTRIKDQKAFIGEEVKILKTKRDLLEKEILELNEKIKKLARSKEFEIVCKSCEELKSKNTKLKETRVKFVKFDKSANSLREMLNNQKSPSCKIGLGFDSDKASTSGTKTMSFIGSSAEKGTDESTIKVHGSTLPGSVCLEPDEWIKDSGCSKHMTGNKSLFSTYKAYDGVKESLNVTFDESPPYTKLSPLVDDDVGVEQAIRKNTKIVNTNNKEEESIEVDEIVNIKKSKNHPLDQNNMYSFDMKNIVPKDGLTCLVAKATSEESMLWHRRLGHVNFKNINKLVKENLVRDLPLKRFENDQTCVACLKGKQHRASCKTKAFSPITKPLFMLHMDLFGLTFVSSLMHKKYCLVVTDDYSRFSWVFFLKTKDETAEILKNFIKEIENLVDKKVKIIRSDNGTEFKNHVMDEFCREKGIKREYSVARTPQQNGVAERKNRTLIEAARTMLADSKLPTTFWAEAVSTACYVQNRVLVVKPHNKTPYELFRGIKPAIGFMKPFGCHVTILNTLDKLGKFDGKSDEGIQGVSESSTSSQQDQPNQDCIVMPIWKDASYFDDASPRSVADAQIQDQNGLHDEIDDSEKTHDDRSLQNNGTTDQQVNTARPKVNTGSREVSTAVPEVNTATPEDLIGPSPASEDSHVEDQEIELGNIPLSYAVPTTPHTRIHKDHLIKHVIGDVQSSVQTRRMKTSYSEKGFLRVSQALRDPAWVEAMQEELLQFKLQKVWILVDLPKGYRAIGTKWVYRNKKDERGIVIKTKQDLLRIKEHTQEAGIAYDESLCPIEEEVYVCQPPSCEDPNHPNKVYKVVKALYGLHQAPRAWYDTLATYLLSNGFQRGINDKKHYLSRNKGHILLVQIYVDDIIFGSTKKELCDEFEKLMKDKFQMSSMGELTFFLGLQVQQKKNGIFISQDKYVHEILRKFNYSDVKSASTPTDLEKPLVQDGDAADVDEHLYRSMIGSLMYLTASRPDIIYLKGKPSLGLWYSKDSSLELVAYTDSDYAGATQDRKSTTGGCQFLGNRLISWQCKKQTVVATSTTEAEYVAAASCCGQISCDQLAIWASTHTDSDKLTFQQGAFFNSMEEVTKMLPPEENNHGQQEGSDKASDEVSTAGAKKDTAMNKLQDYYAEAIRLEEQMNEEQRAQIARDEEIARQWDEEERKRAMDEAKSTKKID